MDRETAEKLYNDYADTVFRIAFLYMKNRTDSEDVVQDTFVQLMRSAPVFQRAGQEKAWLIVTASNLCKSRLRRHWRRDEPLELHPNLTAPEPPVNDVVRAVASLPEKYKTAVFLRYYEGYTSTEIAQITGQKPATIRTWLSRARAELKQKLGDDYDV